MTPSLDTPSGAGFGASQLSFMVTCQSSELGWEVTVELSADFPSQGKGSVMATQEGFD